MNLSDVIPLASSQKKLPAEQRKRLFELQTEIRVLARHGATEPLAQQRTALLNTGWSLAAEGYALPKLANAVDLPRTTTRDARALADRVGFLVMPFEYLSTRYQPPYAQSEQLRALAGFRLYVMAPVGAYSVERHIAGEDAPLHVPQDVAQACRMSRR